MVLVFLLAASFGVEQKHGRAFVYVPQGPREDDHKAAYFLLKNINRLKTVFNTVDVYYIGRCPLSSNCIPDPIIPKRSTYFQKLAIVRNTYLTHVLNHNPDYFIVIDSDMCIRWPDGTLDGVRDFIGDTQISVGSAYGLGQPNTCEENWYVDRLAFQGPNLNPKNYRIQTNGAFGGFAIYRTRDIIKSGCKYNIKTRKCEHHDFHTCLKKKGLNQTIYTNLVIYWKTAIHCHNTKKMTGPPPTLFDLCNTSWSDKHLSSSTSSSSFYTPSSSFLSSSYPSSSSFPPSSFGSTMRGSSSVPVGKSGLNHNARLCDTVPNTSILLWLPHAILIMWCLFLFKKRVETH